MLEKIELELLFTEDKDLDEILKFVLWVKFRKRMHEHFYPAPVRFVQSAYHWVR